MLILISRLFGFGAKKKKLPPWPPEEPIASIPDEALMVMYAGGRTEAFEVLLKRHERGIYNFILRSCGNPSVAEDMTQDVFFKVIRSATKYKQTAKFTTWLYTIARNSCIDRARKHKKASIFSLDQTSSRSDDDDRSRLASVVDQCAESGSVALIRKEFQQQLAAALDALPEDQREVFLLREISGLKFREISEIVGIPENTVKSRMRYALEALRGHLEAFRDFSFDLEEQEDINRTT